MQTAPAKVPDSKALARLGGATLEIVHDLKNQLNGLKLYATFLRKRLERADQPSDERETLAKLILGLDRAAKDLTALVRYARPLDIHTQPGVNLHRLVSNVITEAAQRDTGGLPKINLAFECEDHSLIGEFDPAAVTEAIKAITDDLRAMTPGKQTEPPSINMRRDHDGNTAIIEWHGARLPTRNSSLSDGGETIHTEVARRII